MKTLRRLCAAFVLALALSLSAFAGDMPTGVTAPPPPSQVTTTGDMPTGIAADMGTSVTGNMPAGTTDTGTEFLLNLLQSLLALF